MTPSTPETTSAAPARRYTFRARHRLSHNREYQAVYAGKLKKPVGPLVVFALGNGLAEHRLGLSVGRRVGNAVTRVRIKRGVREAFRLTRHHLPCAPDGGGYDLVVVVRPHTPEGTGQYMNWLSRAVRQISATDQRRDARRKDGDA